MAEKKFYVNVHGRGAVDVSLSNGNLNIPMIQGMARANTPIAFDELFADVVMEILARYPIGNFPIVPESKEDSKFVRDKDDNPNKVLLEDLLMEQREGPGGG